MRKNTLERDAVKFFGLTNIGDLQPMLESDDVFVVKCSICRRVKVNLTTCNYLGGDPVCSCCARQ